MAAKRRNELVWQQAEIVTQFEKGDPLVHCHHCDREFRAGAARLAEHYTGPAQPGGKVNVSRCPRAPQHLVDELKQQSTQKHAQQEKRQRTALLETVLNSIAPTPSTVNPNARAAPPQPTIEQAFASSKKQATDQAVARFCYATGVPFNALVSPYFADMLTAVAAHGPGYKPPGINQLREKLLEDELANVKGAVKGLHSHLVTLYGCSVTSDGWTDTQSRPLLNILYVTPAGAVFVRAVDTSGQVKVLPALYAAACTNQKVLLCDGLSWKACQSQPRRLCRQYFVDQYLGRS